MPKSSATPEGGSQERPDSQQQRAPAQTGWPPASSGEELKDLSVRLKQLFEAKNWPELENFFGVLSEIWFFDSPLSVRGALALAEDGLREANELELSLIRILKAESAGDQRSGSYTCCLMWVEPETWIQHEIEFDLHIGFRRDGDGAWAPAYLGLTLPTPEEVPFPEDPAEAPVGAEGETSKPVLSRTGAGEPEAVAWAFVKPDAPPEPASQHVLVYLPAWVPEEVAQALIRPVPDKKP